MFQSLLNNEIEKLKSKGIPFELENGFYTLADFSEAAAAANVIPLSDSILIVKKISVSGTFVPSAWLAGTTFFQLISKHENGFVNYSNFDFVLYDATCNVWSEFPSVHKVQLIIRYDLTTFLTAVAANVHRAQLDYVKLTPLKK